MQDFAKWYFGFSGPEQLISVSSEDIFSMFRGYGLLKSSGSGSLSAIYICATGSSDCSRSC
jgi:hypothetical protein